ncbi:MAG: hypothetical protein ACK4TP_06100 [Hyphomicrobium sp.]
MARGHLLEARRIAGEDVGDGAVAVPADEGERSQERAHADRGDYRERRPLAGLAPADDQAGAVGGLEPSIGQREHRRRSAHAPPGGDVRLVLGDDDGFLDCPRLRWTPAHAARMRFRDWRSENGGEDQKPGAYSHR